jgi:hypothetical protein
MQVAEIRRLTNDGEAGTEIAGKFAVSKHSRVGFSRDVCQIEWALP